MVSQKKVVKHGLLYMCGCKYVDVYPLFYIRWCIGVGVCLCCCEESSCRFVVVEMVLYRRCCRCAAVDMLLYRCCCINVAEKCRCTLLCRCCFISVAAIVWL